MPFSVPASNEGDRLVLTMSSWPTLRLDVLTDLHLDPQNVRLDIVSVQVEADIMEDLFVNEDALGLVEGIVRIGYLTHEIPIVVKQRGKYIVVEGNRRVAALKAIQNPMLVPEFQARVAALTKGMRDKKALASIEVKVSPNRSQADQLIAALHTTNPRRPWTPARQAAFFQAQIDAGKTYQDLLTRYPTIDVRKFVYRSHIVNLFKSVRYADPALVDFLKSKTWKRGLSVLARIYESREFQDITGLKMDDQGKLTKTVSNATFKEMATTIVRGMMDGNINTRALNSVKSPRFQHLMTELRNIATPGPAPGTSPPSGGKGKPGETTGGAGGSGAGGSGAAGPGGTKPGGTGKGGTPPGQPGGTGGQPKPTAKQHYLQLDHIRPPKTYPLALTRHLGELSKIDVQTCPNAAFLVMRAVLEKSIKSFAEEKNVDIKSTNNHTQGRVQLHHTLKWLLEHVRANGPNTLIQPIEKLRNGKIVYASSTDALNAVNHNHHFLVDPDEAFAMWDSLDSIMRHLMKP